MNFKIKYMEWLENAITSYLPNGYEIKIIEQAGQISNKASKKTIKCYVHFGVGSKQAITSDRVNQPIMFTIISEGDDFRTAMNLFYTLFIDYSKTNDTLNITELVGDANETNVYNVWHNYNTPVMQTAYEQVGEYAYSTIIMTGVLAYSKSKLIGATYTLNGTAVDLITPEAQYNAVVESPMLVGEDVATSYSNAGNNIFKGRMLLDNTQIAKDLVYLAYTGLKKDSTALSTVTLTITYPFFTAGVDEITGPPLVPAVDPILSETITISCLVTQAVVTYDNSNGDNVIDFTLMPKRSWA